MRNISKIWILRILFFWLIVILINKISQNFQKISNILTEDIKNSQKPIQNKIEISENYGENEEWDEPDFQPVLTDRCENTGNCDSNENSYSVTSGIASVVGPRICWNNEPIMSSKVKNDKKLENQIFRFSKNLNLGERICFLIKSWILE